jgi:hypothetical protein
MSETIRTKTVHTTKKLLADRRGNSDVTHGSFHISKIFWAVLALVGIGAHHAGTVTAADGANSTNDVALAKAAAPGGGQVGQTAKTKGAYVP